ncbi:MAG TPA: glutamate--tRNA ligase, partial [bacterium]|nr:glutamate--tRNA ligase [bacterium]
MVRPLRRLGDRHESFSVRFQGHRVSGRRYGENEPKGGCSSGSGKLSDLERTVDVFRCLGGNSLEVDTEQLPTGCFHSTAAGSGVSGDPCAIEKKKIQTGKRVSQIKQDKAESVRTRFAPSPTGRLHIGNARTAVMNWLFTCRMGGRLILRIEDTDEERSGRESETAILKDLQWLGIQWDEGPDLGGPYGPYRQSERTEIYRIHADLLRKEEKAYPCYCTARELEDRRKERIQRGDSAVYDGRCRHLTREERRGLEEEGRLPVLRFRAEAGSVEFDDLIKDHVSFPGDQLGDFVILRANGMPMYNFSCAVDDHLMHISHVIRGDDHVSNTPRQVLLFQAFGWDVPVYAHIPMILGSDRVRLSKRHGAVSVAQFREQGYLPEALVNFLSLLSWSSQTGEEILTLRQLIDEFDFKRVSSSAAVFDTEKLDWMNGVYIRRMEADRLANLVEPFLKESGYSVSGEKLRVLASVLQPKMERLSQISERARPF